MFEPQEDESGEGSHWLMWIESACWWSFTKRQQERILQRIAEGIKVDEGSNPSWLLGYLKIGAKEMIII